MPGTYQYDVEIKSNVAKLLSDMKQVQDRLDTVEGKEYKIKLNVDEKKLSNVISNLENMLDSLGKGTSDFKQFENLSKQLSSITTDIGKISKAFATMDDGSGLVNNIKSIDSSLTNLTNHFVLQVSDKMASSIKEVKGTLSDVGDGKELTPLLNTIGRIESAIDRLSSSVKGIGLNMNIDFGSDTEMEAKAQTNISNALQAYQRLFEHIKMSSAGGSIINTKFFDFDINQYDTAMSKLQAYRKFIENMRNEAKAMYGGQDVLFTDTDKKYWTQASSAMGQVTKTFNKMKAASDTNPLENIFGKTDLTEVLNQLSAIVSKLDEISMSANRFADVFKNGLNVNASVEEIEKLTNRVKELESELAKIKTPTTVVTPQESNISLGDASTTSAEKFQQITNDTVNVLSDVGKTEDQIVQKIQKERAEAEANNEVLREHLVLLDKAGKVVANHWGSTSNVNGTYTEEQLSQAQGGKIIHAHPGKASFFGGKDLQHLLQDSMYDQIKQIELIWGDSTLSVDKSTLTKQSSSIILNIMRSVRKALTEAYRDNQDGVPSREAREHINAIEKEIFKSIAQKLNVSVTEDGSMAKEVTDSLSDVDKAIIKRFSEIKASVVQDVDASSIIKNTMKDAFPNADTKLYEAVTSAKDLDKTLEQVDIPTDSFDKVLEKLDRTKSELVDIVKITKQSVSDADGKFHDSYTLKDSRGSTEIYGVNSKTDKGQILRQNIVGYDKKKDELDISKAQLEVDKQLAKEEDNLAKAQQKKAQAFLKEQANYEEDQKKAELIKRQTLAYEELTDTISKYSEVAKRVAGGNADDGDLELMTKLEDKISQLQKQPILSDSQVSKSEKSLVSLYDQLDKIERKLVETNQKSQDKQIAGFDKRLESYTKKTSGYDATIARFNDGGWTSSTYLENVQAVKNAVHEYETLLNELKGKDASLVTSDDISKLDKYEKKIKDTIATVTNMSAAEKGYSQLAGQKEIDKINKILRENSAMSSEAKAKIKAYKQELISGNPSVSLEKIHGEIMKIVNAEELAGRAGRSMFDVIKEKAFYGFAAQIGMYFGFNDIVNGFKQVASTVRELDTAYTEMRKVSDESAQSLKNFQKESFSTADSVGTIALAMQDATATWMRLGESLDDAKESAKDATVLLNVSEFDNIDEATDSLVAMSQAYKDLDKMEIIDVLDKIGNEYSISTDQLSTALKDSAAVLKTQGNDLAESVALITAGKVITCIYRNIYNRMNLIAGNA